MSGILRKLVRLPVDYPLLRGMVSYALIWPSCSLMQEYLEHGKALKDANWTRAARFGVFGTFFMSPVFYSWMKFSNRFFKKKGLATALTRAAIEQISYSPLAMAYFFFGMSLLEGNSVHTSVNEVRAKFWPTYKIGVIFWPTMQTLNFYFISEKNRIVFVSAASFVWTVYLAHVKGKQLRKDSISDKMHIEQITGSFVDENHEKSSVFLTDTNTSLSENPIVEISSETGDDSEGVPVLVPTRKF